MNKAVKLAGILHVSALRWPLRSYRVVPGVKYFWVLLRHLGAETLAVDFRVNCEHVALTARYVPPHRMLDNA